MALPAVLLKAKSALKKAKVVNDAKNTVNSVSQSSDLSAVASMLGFKKQLLALKIGLVATAAFIFLVLAIFALQSGSHSIELARFFGGGTNNSSSVGNGQGYLNWAMDIANDDSHGYSQCGRTGPDYDCSSLVWYSLVKGANITFTNPKCTSAFTTYVMPECLTSVGFTEYTFKGQEDLQPGDILLRDGHTEIYAGDGQNVGAHIAETGGICGQTGDQTGNEISLGGTGSGWETYYRLTK